MVQMVPCSSAYSPLAAPSGGAGLAAAEFGAGRNDWLEVGGLTYDSRVPSPSLGSYWCESNHSPALYHTAPSPPPPPPSSSPPLPAAPLSLSFEQDPCATLEQLLNDYTYYETKQYGESPHNKQPEELKQLKETAADDSDNALLRQCLRPTDYQQRSHMEFLNQIGSAIVLADQTKASGDQLTTADSYWNTKGNTNNSTNSSGNNHAQGLASVLNLVMEQINEEVRSTCEILGVSPSKWLPENLLLLLTSLD